MCEDGEGRERLPPYLLDVEVHITPDEFQRLSAGARRAACEAATQALRRTLRQERTAEKQRRKAAELARRAEELAKDKARMLAQPDPVTIIYRNHRGEVGPRHINPEQVFFAQSDWHGDEQQWLLGAYDLDKCAYRTFAMRDVLAWDVQR